MDLVAEMERIRAEFLVLENRILPLLLRREQEQGNKATSQEGPHELKTWQRVARDLAAALPTREGRPGIPIDEDFLKGFLHGLAEADFRIRQGRIIWRITNFMPLELDDQSASRVLELMYDAPVDEVGATERLLSEFDEFEDWFLGPLPDVIFVINAMCSLLPCCVEIDVDFVCRAFDLETRIERIRSDISLGEKERKSKLDEWSKLVVMHGFNNALLHVIASLANNHFDQIETFLDHPAREGFYTFLMPHYLIAILHQKVRVVNELLREDSEERL